MKQILFLAFLVILCSLTTAIEVSIPENITTTVNVLYELEIKINNTNNFDIFNLSFTPIQDFTFPIIDLIPKNTEYTTKINITSTSSSEFQTKSSLLSYQYYLDQQHQPVIYQVDILNNLLNPNYKEIQSGDIINWYNTLQQVLTVKALDQSWQLQVNPNSTASKTYNGIMEEDYYIVETGATGKINVTIGQDHILTHNPNLDYTLNFYLRNVYASSSLSVQSLTPEFTMNYSDTLEGAFMLSGTSKVYDIEVISEPNWLEFNKNHFDLNGNSILIYSIKPLINTTEETNKTHTIKVKFKSANAPEVESIINVFIEYAEFVDPELAGLRPIIISEAQLKALCLQYPEACPTRNITITETVNVTTKEIDAINELKDKIDRATYDLNQYNAQMSILNNQTNSIESIQSNLSESVYSMYNNAYNELNWSKTKFNLFLYGFIVIVIIGSLVFGIKTLKNRNEGGLF